MVIIENGAMTFSVTTFSIKTFSITTFSKISFSITTFSKRTLSIIGLIVTLNIMTLGISIMCHYA